MNAKPILTILLFRVLDKTVNFSVLPSEKHEKNENLEDRKKCECYVHKKIKESNIMFSN